MKTSHPLSLFYYCPRCGSAHFQVHDERAKRCTDCGFTYYCNASAATVAVIINQRGELLVARRGQEPAKGTLDLPGGFVDPGEDAITAVLREVQEETGIQGAQLGNFLLSLPNEYVFSGFTVYTCDLFFQVLIPDESELFAQDDAAELLWIPLPDVQPSQFGLTSIRHGIELLLPQLRASHAS